MKIRIMKRRQVVLATIIVLAIAATTAINPQLTRAIIDRALARNDVRQLILLSVLSLLIFVVNQALFLLQTAFSVGMSNSLIA